MGMYNMLVTRMVIIHIKEQIVILCTSIVMWRAYDALCSIKKLILEKYKNRNSKIWYWGEEEECKMTDWEYMYNKGKGEEREVYSTV